MYSWEKPEDRVAIVHMNAELRYAQLELLSAHCATHQLRLRFSTEDLARYAQRDVLRKSAEAASALNDYYASIEKRLLSEEKVASRIALPEEQIRDGIARIAAYFREQQGHYLRSSAPLSAHHKAMMWPFFTPVLLDQIRVVVLEGARVPIPPFYSEARTLGFENLPDFTYLASLTFVDVIVFNETITERALFHALVHAVQFQVLGLERYVELFVRGFLGTKLHFTVPLEAQAFSLEAKFAQHTERFSVEEQVRLWADQGRYERPGKSKDSRSA